MVSCGRSDGMVSRLREEHCTTTRPFLSVHKQLLGHADAMAHKKSTVKCNLSTREYTERKKCFLDAELPTGKLMVSTTLEFKDGHY